MPPADHDQTASRDISEPIAELRLWGWVFADLELSGLGWYHEPYTSWTPSPGRTPGRVARLLRPDRQH